MTIPRTPNNLLRLGMVLFLAACGAEDAGPEYDRDAVWESLELGEEGEFDRKVEALRTVPIDPPPRSFTTQA